MAGAQSTIILSYRREDSAGVTGRIFDRLAQEFGTDRVFMDIDSMPAGVDFHDHLQEILADCGALLVVIGKSWRSQRKGQPARIMDPDDWVRIEVETALERSIPVVPLLIDGATLPNRDQLPESLWPLLRRNAIADATSMPSSPGWSATFGCSWARLPSPSPSQSLPASVRQPPSR